MANAKVKQQEEEKEYEINILYKNGKEVNIRTKMGEKALTKHLQVIGISYREDQPGFLLLEGTFIRISDTSQIETKEIPPLSTEK